MKCKLVRQHPIITKPNLISNQNLFLLFSIWNYSAVNPCLQHLSTSIMMPTHTVAITASPTMQIVSVCTIIGFVCFNSCFFRACFIKLVQSCKVFFDNPLYNPTFFIV